MALLFNPITADNFISQIEQAGNVAVTGTVTGTFKAGDVVSLVSNGTTYKGSVGVDGSFLIFVKGTDLVQDADKTIAGSVETHDASGGVSIVTANKSYGADTGGPNNTTTKIVVNSVTSDNNLTQIESQGNVTITGKVTGVFLPGDVVKLVINGKDYFGNVSGRGDFSIIVKGTDLAADSDKTIDASVAAHNSSGIEGNASGIKLYTVESGIASVSSPSTTEGGDLVYAVTLNAGGSAAQQFSVTLGGGTASTADYGTASFSNGVTYNAVTGKITVPAGVTSFTVTLPTVDDTIQESTETVPLVIGGVTGTGAILDNDSAPTIKTVEPGAPGAGDDAVVEGNNLVYTVTLSNSSSTATEFSYSLGGGTASTADYTSVSFSNGVTYNAVTGKITVPAGVTNFTVTLPTVDDTIQESTETVPLVIGGVTGTGAILDNDSAPTIRTVEPGAPGAGDDAVVEGNNLVYTVTLSNSSSTPTEFSYSLGGGTASTADYGSASFSNGVTYNAVTGKITVPAGVTSFTVTLPTVDDTIQESTETVPLVIGGVTGTGAILDNDSAPTIRTVEPGAPGAGDDAVVEGNNLVYTVTLSNSSSTPTEFSYSLGGGTASTADYGTASFSNGVTYNAVTGKISVPAGVTSFTVTLPTVDDTIQEPTETVPLVIGGVTGTGAILDNDSAPTIRTVEPGAPGAGDDAVVEGNNLVYTVTLSNSSSTATEFSYSLGGGTASPADYGTASFSNGVTYNAGTGKITVPAGVTSFTVTLPTVDDTIQESTETVPLVIGGVTGTGLILDNDVDNTPVQVISVEVGQPGVGDDTVTEGQTLVYNVTLNHASTYVTQFAYALGQGSSSASGADYGTPVFSNGVTYDPATNSITVPAGVSAFSVSVPTVDDILIESTETLVLAVGGKTGTGSIADNDFAPSIHSVEVGQPGVGDDTVTEGQTLVYNVTIDHPSATSATQFAYTLGQGSSTASAADYGAATFSNGVTYDATTGKVTVPAGVSAFSVSVPTLDDRLVESTESLQLTIGGKTGTGYILDEDSNTPVQIESVEVGQPGIADDSVIEGQTLVYNVTLNHASTSATQFAYALGGGSSTASAADYSAVTFSNGVTFDSATNTITVPAGVSVFSVSVPTVDDSISESTETLLLGVGGKVGTGYIVDNDNAPTISSVEVGQPGVADDNVTEGQTLVYNVTLTHASSSATQFSYDLGHGSSTAASNDYGNATFSNGVTYDAATGKISVPAGVTAFSVSLPTVDDNVYEPTETVQLTIGGQTGNGGILDNDYAPNIDHIEVGQPGVGDDTVIEGQTLVYNVTLNHPSSTPTQFAYSLGGGSSASPADIGNASFSNGVTYDAASGKITVPAGVTAFSVTVPTVDDIISEPTEALELTIGGKTGTGYIFDNDHTPTIISVEVGQPGVADDTVTEGTALVYNVTLSNPGSTVTQFAYTLGGSGSSASPDDYGNATFSNGVTYDPVTHLVTVPAGVTAFSVTVPTTDDNVYELTETLQLSVGNKTGTGYILDNDNAPTIKTVEPGAPGAGDDAVVEGNILVYTVTLSNPSSAATEFSYALGGDTASPADYGTASFSNGVTYNAGTGKITVPAGVTSFTVTLPTVDDTIQESTETVPLVIGGITGTGYILDNDSAPTIKTVEPGAPGAGDDAVVEGNNLVYTVTLSNASSTATEFSYSLGGDTASPADYGTASFSNGVTYNAGTGKITVPAGVTSFTVTLPTVDDTIQEPTEIVPLVIGGVTGKGLILDNDSAPTIKTVEPGAPGAGDDAVVEGNNLVYTVTLSNPSSTATEFSYALGGDTASPADYGTASFSNGVTYNAGTGKITVPAGVTSFTVTLPTVDDTIFEATETVPLVIGGVTGRGLILDNDNPTTGGTAKGLEDTPLTLTWAEFHVSSVLPNAQLGVAINTLPANGQLLFNGVAVTAGQIVSKTEIDAGHLVFKPALNESGENEYNLPGVGNKLNDYAKFDYTVTQGTANVGHSAAFYVDIAPVADAPTGVSTLGALDISLVPFYYINMPAVYQINGWLTWQSVTFRGHTDNDGSEMHTARVTVLGSPGYYAWGDLGGGDSVIALPNGKYIASNKTTNYDSNAYWDPLTKEFVINTDVYKKIYAPQFHTSGFDGWADHAVDIVVNNISKEVTKDGVVLDVANGIDHFHTNPQGGTSPLVLDLNHDGVHTLDLAHGVQFDLLNQGHQVQTGWVDQHDGLLALDLNHDGQINSGAELFGQATQLADGSVAKDGFQALTQYDSNHDGQIDANDAVFSQLKVWVDANSDGVTQNGELLNLAQAGVANISLASQSSTATDNGNLLGLLGAYCGSDGAQHEMADVWFLYSNSSASSTLPDALAPKEQAAVQSDPVAALLSADHSLDILLAEAGLSAAPQAKPTEAFAEVRAMEAMPLAVLHPEHV